MAKICKEAACGRTAVGRGLCGKHYQQWRKSELPHCSVPRCGRTVRAKGLCQTHWKLMRAGLPLGNIAPRRPAGSTLVRDGLGRKECSLCGSFKPESDFSRAPATLDGLFAYCIECRRGQQRVRRLLEHYNLSPQAIASIIVRQRGCCPICQRALTDKFVVDHDHKCCPESKSSCGKCIRGFLCDSCNRGIGLLGDSSANLQRARSYLQGDAPERDTPVEHPNLAATAGRLGLAQLNLCSQLLSAVA